MKIPVFAILSMIAGSSALAQSLPIGTSYNDALQRLDARDRPGSQGSTDNGNDKSLSTTQRRAVDYNRRLGHRMGSTPHRPERLGKADR